MSDHNEFDRLDSLFSEALEMPAEQREAWLERIGDADPELARSLRRLLTRAEQAETFLGPKAELSRDTALARSLAANRARAQRGTLPEGTRLGAYRVERLIGRGLRSAVYLGSRTEEGWAQTVAIKILARGVNTDDVYRRFLAERQILTELRFPGISLLLDGGITDDGLPYFVMEYIEGTPITEHCASRRLGRDERISLFAQVCDAVAHAHRHLVVHRDIKPSNILVDIGGRVKLLDFGIAKLLGPPADGAAYLTADDVRPMTPAYASPEQESGAPVTTATDVYQLGLLLAELLTGQGPPRGVLGIESQRIPERAPSQVPASEDLPYSPKTLAGDLDWIVLRALEPESDSRYASAVELAADIDRFRNGLPVSARSWTVPYLAKKFLRRRPGVGIAAGVALLALTVIVSLVGYYNIHLGRERMAAVQAAERAEETKDLLIRFLSSPDPYSGSGAATRVSDLLKHAHAVVMEELQHRPELQVELLDTLGDVHLNLDMSDSAIALRAAQLQILEERQPAHSLPVLMARRKLALAHLQAGKVEKALTELQSVLVGLEGLQPRDEFSLARVKTDIGTLLIAHGATADARPYLEEAIALYGPELSAPAGLAEALRSYAYVFEDYAVRLAHLRRAHRLKISHLGAAHPETLDMSAQIAATLTDLGRFDDSLEAYRELIPVMEQAFGPLHSETLGVMNNRAISLYFAGEPDQAIDEQREILERKRARLGEDHPDVADTLQNLGVLMIEQNRHAEAIDLLSEAATIYEKVNLEGNPVSAYPHISLAGIYSRLGRPEDIEYHARRALALLDGHVSVSNVAWLKSRCLLGDALIGQGAVEEGIPMVREALEGMVGQTRLSPMHVEQCREILRKTQDDETRSRPAGS